MPTKRQAPTTARRRAPRRGSHRPPAHGGGRRLAEAFEALERLPALAESRKRVMRIASQENPAVNELIAAVECDVALTLATMRFANKRSNGRGKVGSVPQAVELLGVSGVAAIAGATPGYDFFERNGSWDRGPERFRLHAVATQRAADAIAAASHNDDRDELLLAALIHDIGKLVLARAYPGYPEQIHRGAETPEARLKAERAELGIDHALVGGVLVRRWRLPGKLASAIERHHADDAEGDAALVRLADMVAHYGQGSVVAPDQLSAAADACGFDPDGLRGVLYELPYPSRDRQRPSEPCPLSGREVEVLRRLAEGKVYKQIAHDMSLSTSTVRTHLHNVYGKLGAVDRAQAVLIATERAWI
jgi:putative nucleotidyltransferase with HDIG domain